MSITPLVLLVLTAVAIFALLSKRIENSLLTLPIIFTGLGILLSQSGLGMITLEHNHHAIHLLVEITLIIVLFSDASQVKLSTLKHNFSIPGRMLLIGMPLTILLGSFVAQWASPQAPWALALLTAAILTPTDAALGQSVVSNPSVPEQIRQSINVESGLNDGLAFPVVLVAATLTAQMSESHVVDNLLVFISKQIGLGVLTGLFIAFLTAKLLDKAIKAATITTVTQGLYFLVTAFICYFAAELIGGNGFIAVFIGGLTFGNTLKAPSVFIHEFMEGEGQIFTIATFLIFGAILAPICFEHINVKTIALAISFLTFVRIIPVVISLTGTNLSNYEKFFLGWFGPRGLASILFVLFVLKEYSFPGSEELIACVVLTVLISIVVHGVSAKPMANKFTQ